MISLEVAFLIEDLVIRVIEFCVVFDQIGGVGADHELVVSYGLVVVILCSVAVILECLVIGIGFRLLVKNVCVHLSQHFGQLVDGGVCCQLSLNGHH